jgi:hypothetical protein
LHEQAAWGQCPKSLPVPKTSVFWVRRQKRGKMARREYLN